MSQHDSSRDVACTLTEEQERERSEEVRSRLISAYLGFGESEDGVTRYIDLDEVEMIEGVFELGDTVAREVMVPRPDVETVTASMPLSELRSVAATGTYMRYLVLDEDGNQLLGFVHAKDVLRASETETEQDSTITARELARAVLTVPETRRIDAILADFQTRDESQMAVVVDEWGVFEGIVTIEDILEEIVGEIPDEFDTGTQEPSIENRADGAYTVDGGVPVQEVNDRLDTDSKGTMSRRSVGWSSAVSVGFPKWAIRSNRTGTSFG